MQRSAVNRVSDLLAVVVYSVFNLYNIRWDIPYTYEVFGLHQSTHALDMVLFWVITVYIGYWWVVKLRDVLSYHTLAWTYYNLGVYLPLLFQRLGEFFSRIFWLGLVNLALWMVRHLLVLASRGMSQAYPGRGMVFSLDFEDERDFKELVRSAREEGLPFTASKGGRPILPEEFDTSLTYDTDILTTFQPYTPLAKLPVVDADKHNDD